MRAAVSMMLTALVAAALPFEAECDSHDSATLAALGTTPDAPYDPRWTTVERQVWTKLSVGDKVDLPGHCPDWWATKSQTNERDPATHTVSGEFVTQLMSEPGYRTVTANLPITISGAHISGDVLVQGGGSVRSLTLACSVIDGDLKFLEVDVVGQINLYRVRTTGNVEFSDVRVSSSIGVLRSDVGALKVVASRIDGSLALRGTRVRGTTQVLSTTVGRGVRLGCPVGVDDPRMAGCLARYGETDFRSIHLGGLMEIGPSVFLGKMTLQSIDVGLSFVAYGVDYHDHFSIVDGTIGQRIQMVNSVARASIFAEGVRTGGSLSLRGGSYGNVAIRGAEVGGDLDFRASVFRFLDLTGTIAGGELRLAAGDEVIGWSAPGPDVRFVLKNTRVESLQDTRAAWPPWVKHELDGFEYRKIGGLELPSVTAPSLRGVEWFKQWLAGDDSFTPQPYRHLSTVLRSQGQVETANAVLFEAKERERKALPLYDWNRIWLEVLRWTIGYGIGLKALSALGWMASLCIAGWIVAACAVRKWRPIPWTLLWYSASYTVPGFTVVKIDEVLLPLWARSCFYVQRLLGYGLALFAAAAAVGVVQP